MIANGIGLRQGDGGEEEGLGVKHGGFVKEAWENNDGQLECELRRDVGFWNFGWWRLMALMGRGVEMKMEWLGNGGVRCRPPFPVLDHSHYRTSSIASANAHSPAVHHRLPGHPSQTLDHHFQLPPPRSPCAPPPTTITPKPTASHARSRASPPPSSLRKRPKPLPRIPISQLRPPPPTTPFQPHRNHEQLPSTVSHSSRLQTPRAETTTARQTQLRDSRVSIESSTAGCAAHTGRSESGLPPPLFFCQLLVALPHSAAHLLTARRHQPPPCFVPWLSPHHRQC
ncbi:unnamed protein product [Sphenostylis stenocarpa]|uniref:Uncharacterized protein n=1 Tax=Sphenostylis stenocarpa TaxID=92480 RepID=A0AA86VF58_9FABA|nr:unnamed protein product [Sphenostylis stenocarpa]